MMSTTDLRDARRRHIAARNAIITRPALRSLWRHRRTGDRYRVESWSDGSGDLHGHVIINYRRISTDSALYSRLLLEWHDKMEQVDT